MDGSVSITVFVTVVGSLILVAGAVVLIYQRITRKMLTPLLSIVEGKIPNFAENIGVTTLDGSWRNEKTKIEIGVTKTGIPDWIFITLYRPFPFEVLRILPRDKEKFIVVSSPEEGFLPWPTFRIKISDEELESGASFDTPEEERIGKFLTAVRRNIIRDIFRKRFNSIEISRDYIKIGMTTYWGGVSAYRICKDLLNPETANEALTELLEFSQNI